MTAEQRKREIIVLRMILLAVNGNEVDLTRERLVSDAISFGADFKVTELEVETVLCKSVQTIMLEHKELS